MAMDGKEIDPNDTIEQMQLSELRRREKLEHDAFKRQFALDKQAAEAYAERNNSIIRFVNVFSAITMKIFFVAFFTFAFVHIMGAAEAEYGSKVLASITISAAIFGYYIAKVFKQRNDN